MDSGAPGAGAAGGGEHHPLGSLKTFNWTDGLCSDSQTLKSPRAVPAQLDREEAAGRAGERAGESREREEAAGRERGEDAQWRDAPL